LRHVDGEGNKIRTINSNPSSTYKYATVVIAANQGCQLYFFKKSQKFPTKLPKKTKHSSENI